MAKQIKEATETIVKVVRISGKTKPLAINGKENTDNVVFLRAFDAESGAKLDTPLSITESRAKMFGFSCLCISEETVSYTHLDVYKRQNFSFSLNSNSPILLSI